MRVSCVISLCVFKPPTGVSTGGLKKVMFTHCRSRPVEISEHEVSEEEEEVIRRRRRLERHGVMTGDKRQTETQRERERGVRL